jgi:hypothetical protein
VTRPTVSHSRTRSRTVSAVREGEGPVDPQGKRPPASQWSRVLSQRASRECVWWSSCFRMHAEGGKVPCSEPRSCARLARVLGVRLR